MAAPKAAIIGVLGQDGGYLAQLLLNKGYEVHGTSRAPERVGSSPLRALGLHRQVRLHAMMPTDFSSVLPFLQQVGADEIYNLSGQSSVASSFRQPLETFASITTATMNFLECIRLLGSGVRYYNASSSEMFGNTPTPADEATPFRPRSPYATAKAAAHHAVANYREAYGLRACSGILFNHESPFRPEQFVTRKVVCAARRIAAGSPERLSLGNVEIHRDWGWAEEYVESMWRMLQQETLEDFVIATGHTHSLWEFVEGVFAGLNLTAREHVDLEPHLRRPSDIAYSAANPAKAKRALGWEAKSDLPQVIDRLLAAPSAA